MSLTPDQINQLKSISPTAGGTPGGSIPNGQPMDETQFNSWIGKATPSASAGGFHPINDIVDQAKSGVNQMKQSYEQAKTATDPLSKTEAGMGMLAGGVATATAPLAPAIKPVGDVAQWLGEKLGNTSQMQDFVTNHPDAATALQRIATDTSNTSAVLGTAMGAEGSVSGVPKALDAVNDTVNTVKGVNAVSDAIPKETPTISPAEQAKHDAYISDQYTKAIKPTIVGKTNPGQLERYNGNVSSAVKTIVDNKPSLKLTDQFGDETGKLPETIDQFRQAIEQSKASIFKQYDAMAKTAGENGAKVDLTPAATELQKIASDKVVTDLHPELAAYAKAKADTLLSRESYTTEEAQSAVQNFNKSLEAYYRNPSYETASRASVDAMIANKLREGLDSSIEGTGAPGYAALKAKYAALKSIEKDVTKRGIVEARQTGGRGLGVGDVVSAEEVIRGLATMNPTALVTGAAIKGIQALRRYYTDPNRAVKLMFEKADSTSKGGTSSQPTTPVEQPQSQSVIESSPKP